MLPSDASLDDVTEYFRNDRFATEVAGCRTLEAHEGYARCKMDLEPKHLNAAGHVMGGAIFTLADFALAVASNINRNSTSISNSIEFMSAPKGTTLFAEARADKAGRTTGFYTVDVTDDTDRRIARMVAVCHFFE